MTKSTACAALTQATSAASLASKPRASSPAREALPQLTPPVGEQLQQWLDARGTDDGDYSSIRADVESLTQGSAFACLEHYLPFVYARPASLLDYAPDDSLILLEDSPLLEDTAADIAQKADDNRADAQSRFQITAGHPFPYRSWEALSRDLARFARLDMSTLGTPSAFGPGERFGGQLRLMLNRVRQARNLGDRVVVITEQVERLENLWYEQDTSAIIPTIESIEEAPPAGTLRFVRATAAEGLVLPGK